MGGAARCKIISLPFIDSDARCAPKPPKRLSRDLGDRAQQLDAGQQNTREAEILELQHCLGQKGDGSMVLLDDVVRICVMHNARGVCTALNSGSVAGFQAFQWMTH
jgi:hypothetical protein